MLGPRKEYMPRSPMREGKPHREKRIEKSRERIRHEGRKSLRRGKTEWDVVREREVKPQFKAWGIETCELRRPGCFYDDHLSFAHTKKVRHWQGDDIYQVVLCCTPCHTSVELLGEAKMKPILEQVIRERAARLAALEAA